MAKDREIVCEFYSYHNGPCGKRGILVKMRDQCQTCSFYKPIKNGRPARIDKRRKEADRRTKQELKNNY